MNVSELARKLKMRTNELLDVLPEFGFDIGKKAIKIDDRVAAQIMKQWKYIKRELQKREAAAQERQRQAEKEARKTQGLTVALPSLIRVKNFAEKLNLPVAKILTELMKSGILTGQNENIDFDTASIVAQDLGFTVMQESATQVVVEHESVSALQQALEEDKAYADLKQRPPVVVVMGHVDHGKTKLLDAIRHTNVIAGEAGGITQHIGAYQVAWQGKDKKLPPRLITFIDTPGHEAFTVMRSRGAKVADIAILVVAADDGVKPQTVEVIHILKAAKLPFVVAINKVDKDGANPEKVRQELSQYNILSEAWGGDVPMVEISAKNNLNIDALLDVLLILADMHPEKLQARVDRPALGTIIESHIDKGQGPIATVLVHAGTLHAGDPLVVNGELFGKVRAMKNFKGEDIKEALPSIPVLLLGFKAAPLVGDILDVAKADSADRIDPKAKYAEQRAAQRHTVHLKSDVEESEKKVFPVFVKADTLGSLEAILGSFAKMQHPEVGVKVVGKGLGNLTMADVQQAQSTGAQIFAFNVQTQPAAARYIHDKQIPFFEYDVIYDLINYVREQLEKLLNPEKIITELGVLNVLAIFHGDKKGQVVGGRLAEGKAVLNAKVRLMRGGEELATGDIVALQMNKSDVKEVPNGSECGLKIMVREKVEVGDTLMIYSEESHKRKIQFVP